MSISKPCATLDCPACGSPALAGDENTIAYACGGYWRIGDALACRITSPHYGAIFRALLDCDRAVVQTALHAKLPSPACDKLSPRNVLEILRTLERNGVARATAGSGKVKWGMALDRLPASVVSAIHDAREALAELRSVRQRANSAAAELAQSASMSAPNPDALSIQGHEQESGRCDIDGGERS